MNNRPEQDKSPARIDAQGAALEQVFIQPRPWPDDPQLGPTALLCLVAGDLKLTVELAGECRRLAVRDFFRVYSTASGPALAGGALGAPAAVMAAEKLFALGVKNLFFTGWSGSLSHRAPAGSIICPTWSAAEEGVSAHYPSKERPLADRGMIEALERAARDLAPAEVLIKGPVWTTDALYRETKSKAALYRAEGMLAVEMEVSALLAVSRFRGVKTAGLLVVSDELFGTSWRPGFSLDRVTKARRLAAQIALKAADIFKFDGVDPVFE